MYTHSGRSGQRWAIYSHAYSASVAKIFRKCRRVRYARGYWNETNSVEPPFNGLAAVGFTAHRVHKGAINPAVSQSQSRKCSLTKSSRLVPPNYHQCIYIFAKIFSQTCELRYYYIYYAFKWLRFIALAQATWNTRLILALLPSITHVGVCVCMCVGVSWR